MISSAGNVAKEHEEPMTSYKKLILVAKKLQLARQPGAVVPQPGTSIPAGQGAAAALRSP